MVLMEIVICLHALVSVEHPGAAVGTYMVRLWRMRAKNPQVSLSYCSQDAGGSTWEPEVDGAVVGMVGC